MAYKLAVLEILRNLY